jgi:hypothetical protein
MAFLQYFFNRPGAAGPAFERWGSMLIGAYIALALAILLLGAVMRVFSARHAVRLRVTNATVTWGIALQLIGLVILGLRVTDFPLLSLRIWMTLHLIAELAAAGYLVWWMQTWYPQEAAEFEWQERKRDYLPRGSRRR